MGALGLSLSAAYGYWYFTDAYPTLAPEFAVAGLQSHWWNWLGAIAMVSLAIPFVAYRLAILPNSAIADEKLSYQ